MLHSVLLSITPTEPTMLEGFYGRQVQAWFLGLLAQHRPDMVEAMHQDNALRPYTVSSLIVPKGGGRGKNGRLYITPGMECQIRITTLTGEISNLFFSQIVPGFKQNTEMRLKWSRFREIRLLEQNQWDGSVTFEKLVAGAVHSSGDSVTLNFSSPTAFRKGGLDLTMPTPDQVWRSLWWRWNNFAPEELQIDPLWVKFAQKCIVISDYSLKTLKVQFKKGDKGAATGATGQATYRLLPARLCGNFSNYRPGADAVLRSLADFALYAGVGHHTTIGLGQTQRIGSRIPAIDRTLK